ncbi:MAG TPA: CcmD family protein [Chitinophagaceae bacterium]
MSRSKKIIAAFTLLMMMSMNMSAQEKVVEMADTMRSNGRIYVVVAVILTILIGLILYLWRIDRKISKLEKEN